MKKASASQSSAFTLVELLVVMAVIVLMGALIVPAVSGSLKGTALNQSSQTLLSAFNAAQQTALAKGQSIQVRLYLMPDPDSTTASTDQNSQAAPWRIHGLQLFTSQPNQDPTTVAQYPVVYVPLNKVELFPNSIVIDNGATLSSLCDNSITTQFVPSTSSDKKFLLPTLPRVGTNYSYYHFDFRPDGTTTLDANKSWFVTLHTAIVRDGLSQPPSNFFTVAVDPVQGSTRVFRPQ